MPRAISRKKTTVEQENKSEWVSISTKKWKIKRKYETEDYYLMTLHDNRFTEPTNTPECRVTSNLAKIKKITENPFQMRDKKIYDENI